MNLNAVVYRNEGRDRAVRALQMLRDQEMAAATTRGIERAAWFRRQDAALADAITALSQPYTLHTLCKTPECAVESISPFEGAEVFGMATIAVESEPVSGLRYRVRAMAESECGTCAPEGVFTTEGHGPFDCYACGKKATALREAAAAGITDHQRRMRGTNPGSNE